MAVGPKFHKQPFERKVQGGWNYPDENDYCRLCGGAPLSLKRQDIAQKRQRRFDALSERLKAAKAKGMTHKTWKTVGGTTVRPSHMGVNGQKVTIDDRFRIGNEMLFLPSDPKASLAETANCRCDVTFSKEKSSNSQIGATAVSLRGIQFIKKHEGFVSSIDPDPIGLPTIGYGHKLTRAEKVNGTFKDGITQAQADALLQRDIAVVQSVIRSQITVKLTQNQYDALASLIFNVGGAKFSGFRLKREVNKGNFETAAKEFLDINKAGGRVLNGLTNRRREESKLFLTPDG